MISCNMLSGFTVCFVQEVLLGCSNKEERDWRDMRHEREVRNSYKLLAGKSEGKNPLGRPDIKWGTPLKWISNK
jgi:hypothetical protein